METEEEFRDRVGAENFALSLKDLKNLYRQDYIISQLELYQEVDVKRNIKQLRNLLITQKKKNHPINGQLNALSNDEIATEF